MSFFRVFVTVLAITSAIVVWQIIDLYEIFQLPEKPIVRETWWGERDSSNADERIHPFKINISQNVLDDLQYRLEHARPLRTPLEPNQRYGFNGKLASEILAYWKTAYEWRKSERYLNKYPQFVTNIQGLKIHFIHVKPNSTSGHLRVFPLLILHGWPGSLREFYEIIPILTSPQKDRDFVFEVIAPHLPGFAFSEASTKPGLGTHEIALIMKNLMNRLGFTKFFTQGGDLGSMILHAMAVSFEDSILGYHSNMCLSIHPLSLTKLIVGSVYPSWIGSEWHQAQTYPVRKLLSFLLSELGYMFIQGSKPDSLGVAMDDSPIGLASYFLEKFSTGANFDNRFREDGGLKETFTYDELLDNIMLYWINRSATTAFRLYSEILNMKNFKQNFWLPIKVPTMCARFKYDFIAPDGVIGDLYHNLVQVTDYDGGHFAALENPRLLANDIFQGIAKLTSNETCY